VIECLPSKGGRKGGRERKEKEREREREKERERKVSDLIDAKYLQ
jgi:hypothetical protein